MFSFKSPRYQPGDVIDVAGSPVRLQVNSRARRVSLRLDAARREVVATAPSERALKDAVAFAGTRAEWMAALLDRLPRAELFEAGAEINLAGRPCLLELAAGAPSRGLVEDEFGLRLFAAGAGETYNRAVVRVLKAEALKILRARTYAHCEMLGVAIPEVKVMEARSRWGSCTPPRAGRIGRIRYCWRLVLAPMKVLDYVAAHEVAHLVRADHSPAFWEEVAKLVPDVKAGRAWLRAHGSKLHAAG